ncbi:MAG: GntR family transcriptional regulator [Candidatus Alectryocaccobium sp.]|jgi:DNA-binding GntR family transcriptional regulator
MAKRDETGSKKKQAYDQIKKMIIENEVEKDAPLVERVLCERLGISRTPVREALRELAADGLVNIIEGKGVYVKRIDFKDMIEIFEVREALERKAIQLFIERMDEESFKKLEEYMKEQEEAYSLEKHKEFMDVDMKIHFLIADGARNSHLKDYIVLIYDQIRQIAISSKDDTVIRDMAMNAHRKILKAVEERDVEAAEKAVVEHINDTMKIHKDRYYLL